MHYFIFGYEMVILVPQFYELFPRFMKVTDNDIKTKILGRNKITMCKGEMVNCSNCDCSKPVF